MLFGMGEWKRVADQKASSGIRADFAEFKVQLESQGDIKRSVAATTFGETKAEAAAIVSGELPILPKGVQDIINGYINPWNYVEALKIKQRIFGKHNRRSIINSIIQLSDNRIASCSDDKTIKIWNLKTGECIATLEGHTDDVHSLIKLSENRIASGSRDKTIKIWNIEIPEHAHCIATLKGHEYGILLLVKLSENRIASGSLDSTLKIWDLDTHRCILTIDLPERDDYVGGKWHVRSLIKLSDNSIAIGSDDGRINIWDFELAKYVASFEGHTGYIFSMIQLSDNRIASASQDKTIKIWTLGSSTCVTLRGHTDWVTSLVELSENRMVSGSYRTIKIWDLETGTCIATYNNDGGGVRSLIKLSDNRIVLGSLSETVRICEVDGAMLKILYGQPVEPSSSTQTEDTDEIGEFLQEIQD